MMLRWDCSHFPGDRPCSFHKETGIVCEACPHYDPVKQKILVIKFDALGDVLRTTALLPALKKKYPEAHIVWLTKSNARDLFTNLPLVHEVFCIEDPSAMPRLMAQTFDLIVHPDASPVSAAYATLLPAHKKLGFGVNEHGKVKPLNPEAEEWFELGAFDHLKKKNTKPYQRVVHEIAGLPYERGEIQLVLSDEEKKWAADFKQKHDLGRFDFLVGLNTGAGGRWKYKKWTFEGYRDLIGELSRRFSCGVLLYGGPEEVERNRELKKIHPNVVDTGSDNPLRRFFALVSLADIMVTGDTMALHASAALKKQAICLFGPTSAHEIEDYGRITKIQPALDCLVCYKMDCDFVPNCMESISVSMVVQAIENAAKKSR